MASSSPPPPPPPPGDGPSAGGGGDSSESLNALRKKLRDKYRSAAAAAAAAAPASHRPPPQRPSSEAAANHPTVLRGDTTPSSFIPAPPPPRVVPPSSALRLRTGGGNPPRSTPSRSRTSFSGGQSRPEIHRRFRAPAPSPSGQQRTLDLYSSDSDVEILDTPSIPLPMPSPAASSAGGSGDLIRAPHLGEGLQECLKSLRKFALQTDNERKSDEVKKVIKAAEDVVNSFYRSIWFIEGYQRAAQKRFNTFSDFKRISVCEYDKMKKEVPENPDNILLIQFKKGWNDAERDDEIQVIAKAIPNVACPITGAPISEIKDPVRNIDCGHVYERSAIMVYSQNKKQCPCMACPRYTYPDLLLCDDNLKEDIEATKSFGSAEDADTEKSMIL